jgi:hypothetical protein
VKIKRTKHSKMLGIAVGDKSMLVAEVIVSGGKYQAVRTGQYVYAEGQGLSVPETLGQGLNQFLKANGFATRRAVFGMPAKWVLTKPKEVPAADEATIASSLRLQAEGDFSPELKDLVFDYVGQGSRSEARSVLLLATPRKNIDNIKAIADSAKVDIESVTVSLSALATATAKMRKDSLVLAMGPGGTELGSQPQEGVAVLRHVGPASTSAAPMLLGELRRATAQPTGGNGFGNGSGNGPTNGNGRAQRELILWDDVDSGSAATTALAACRGMGEAAGLSVLDGDLSTLGVSTGPEARGRASMAVALALEGMQGRLPIDFLDTRLAPPKEQRYDPRVVYGVAAGVLVALLAGAAWYDSYRLDSQLTAIQKQIEKGTPEHKRVLAESDRILQIRGWHNESPKLLSCLYELTKDLPAGDAFLISFSAHQDAKNGDILGQIQGRVGTNNTGPVLTLVEQMQRSTRFTNLGGDAHITTSRTGSAAAAAAPEASFNWNFTYIPDPSLPGAGPGSSAPTRSPQVRQGRNTNQ